MVGVSRAFGAAALSNGTGYGILAKSGLPVQTPNFTRVASCSSRPTKLPRHNFIETHCGALPRIHLHSWSLNLSQALYNIKIPCMKPSGRDLPILTPAVL
jgi:hypothetical protein